MEKNFRSNFWLLLLLSALLGYLLNFVALDVVKNETLWQQHLNEKYDVKYNEYKEFDIDLSEFEDELKEFEQQSEEEDTSYGWDFFYVDSLVVLVPLLVVTFGFSCVLLLLFLFNKSLVIVKYLIILKATIIGYFLFFIPEIISNIYFLVFKRDYKIEDVNAFNKHFNLNSLFNKEQFPEWLWTAISDFQIIYIFFPALVAYGIKIIYKQFSLWVLFGYSYLAYLIAFIFYEIIMWYIFGF